jgi:8-oxo-dGTP pyrophosphatase MutT (NUDIX family)
MIQILRFRQRLTRLWLRTFGPRWTVGCLVVLRDAQDRVCFLKHKGRLKPWGLPGGLMEWPEAPLAALRREMLEELGWCSSGALVHRRTAVSEHFPLLELIFEAKARVSERDCASWVFQGSEIDGYSWLTAEDIQNHDGILARHKSAVLDVLRTE